MLVMVSKIDESFIEFIHSMKLLTAA